MLDSIKLYWENRLARVVLQLLISPINVYILHITITNKSRKKGITPGLNEIPNFFQPVKNFNYICNRGGLMYFFTGKLVLHSNPGYRSPPLILREWSSLFPDGRQSLGNTKRRFHSNVLLDCPRCLLDLSSLVTVTEGSLLTGQSGIVGGICRR